MNDYQYIGSELEIFAHASKWKAYVRLKLHNSLVGDVLEVGAGIGSATKAFYDGTQRRWVCLEPDARLAVQIPRSTLANPEKCEIRIGTISDLDARELFDAVLYMDVLEHVEDDKAELALAAQHLKPEGFLIVVAPALQWLFTSFDKAIGHYRRYSKGSLRMLTPSGLRLESCQYLDSVGLLASAGNRLLLRSAKPTAAQILFWDRFLVPASRTMDRALRYSTGRSVLAIWRKVA